MFAKTSSFQKEQNLSIVQIVTANQNTFNYISGLSAMNDNLIEVKEVSEGGMVNTCCMCLICRTSSYSLWTEIFFPEQSRTECLTLQYC